MLHVYAPTTTAMLLIGARDAKNVLRFPGDRNALPGLLVKVRPLLPINEQLIDRAAEVFGPSVRSKVQVVQEFADPITLENGDMSTLYLATIDANLADASWQSMPDIMRGLPKDRSRLPYLRAWQILSGGLQVNTKAIEVDDKQLGEFFKDE